MFKAFLLTATTAISVLAYCYAVRIGHFAPQFSRERFFEVKATIKASPEGVIVFGDSIVEGAPLPAQLNGVPIVNAGVGGAGVDYFRRYSSELLGRAHPRLIVLAVGINDATSADASRQFGSRYAEAVRFLETRAPVLLATVTPVQDGPLAAAIFDPQQVPRFNQTILEVAGNRPVINLNAALSGGNFTHDGVHLTNGGYDRWLRTLSEGIAAALAKQER